MRSRYDVVVVGGGHNGLVAAAYLARAGRSVLVLERLPQTGGAAVSARPFAGVDARISRYSYLVSLLPDRIVRELGLRFRTRERPSYTLVVRRRILGRRDRGAPRSALAMPADLGLAASTRAAPASRRAVAPTLLEPLRARDGAARARSATTRPGRACSSGRWASCSRPRSTTTSCAGSRSPTR